MKILLQQGNNTAFNDDKRNKKNLKMHTALLARTNQRRVNIVQITREH